GPGPRTRSSVTSGGWCTRRCTDRGPGPVRRRSGQVGHRVQVGQVVVETLPLGPQVGDVALARRYQQRHLLGDLHAVADQRLPLAGVVGHQPDRPHTQVLEHPGGDGVVAGVHRQAEGEVRLDGVQTLRLQGHRPQLRQQTDAPALVAPQVDDDARPFGDDGAHRGVELVPALAVLRAERVPGQALRVQPDEDTLRADVAVHQSDLFVTAVVVQVADRLERAVHGGQGGVHDAFHAGPLRGLLAEYAYVFCHDSRVPKQRRKAVRIMSGSPKRSAASGPVHGLLPADTTEDVRKRGAVVSRQIAILPGGSYEQHGAYLPLATDTLVACAVAREIAGAYPVHLLPPVTVSCSHEHAAWPGTVSISAVTLHAVVRDIADSLRRSGVDTLVLVNGHDGNYVLGNVVQEASARGERMALFPAVEDW